MVLGNGSHQRCVLPAVSLRAYSSTFGLRPGAPVTLGLTQF